MPVYPKLCWAPSLNKTGSQRHVPHILYVQALLPLFHMHGWVAPRNVDHHLLSRIAHKACLAGFKICLFVHIEQRERVHPTTEEVPGFVEEEEEEEDVEAYSVMGWCVAGAAAAVDLSL